jgi:hypothetical protein
MLAGSHNFPGAPIICWLPVVACRRRGWSRLSRRWPGSRAYQGHTLRTLAACRRRPTPAGRACNLDVSMFWLLLAARCGTQAPSVCVVGAGGGRPCYQGHLVESPAAAALPARRTCMFLYIFAFAGCPSWHAGPGPGHTKVTLSRLLPRPYPPAAGRTYSWHAGPVTRGCSDGQRARDDTC